MQSQCEYTPAFQTAADELIRQKIKLVLQDHHQPEVANDRRYDVREPFPYPIHITPVGADGVAHTDETFVVLGKHLSERGVDFYYEAPIPHRRVIASLAYADGQWLGVLLDLRWCRSNKHGWYENGGRFLQVVDSPVS